MQIIILKTATGLPPIPLSHNIINNNNQLAHRGGVEPPHVTTTLLKVNVDFVSKQLRMHLNSTHMAEFDLALAAELPMYITSSIRHEPNEVFFKNYKTLKMRNVKNLS